MRPTFLPSRFRWLCLPTLLGGGISLLLVGGPVSTTAAQTPTITEFNPQATPKPRRRPKPRPSPSPAETTTATAPSSTTAATTAPPLLWKTLIRRSDGSPTLVGNTAYVAAGGQVQQIDSGGRTLFASDVGPTQGTPTVDETRIYLGTNRGTVYGLNRKTGQPLWKWTGATDAILTQPAVGAGRVYVESSDNNVYGLAASTGGCIWSFTRRDGSLGYSSPVFVRGSDPALSPTSKTDTLFVCGETTVYRLDPATGKEGWHSFVGGKSLASPAIGAGKVFVGGDGAGLSAFSASDGKPLWNYQGKGELNWFGTPLYADGTVYVTTYQRYVYALDAATGKQRWAFRLLGNALAVPVIDPRTHTLFVTSTTFRDNPTLTALDARTGKKRWDTPLVGYVSGSPVLNETGDRLYVAGTTNGYLYCFGIK